MPELPKVSICISTYNRASMVCEAIDSVLAQDYPGEIEIVVVDDASSDDTLETLRERYGDRIRLFANEENLGIGGTNHRALSEATGEMRGVLDSDDWYAPEFVRTCVEELLANPGVGLVYTDSTIMGAGNPKYWATLDWSLEGLLRTCNLTGDSWLARWELMRRTPCYDERCRQDADFDFYFSMARITEFKRIPKPLHCFREHRKRTSNTSGMARRAYYHALVLGKWGHSIEYAFIRADRFRAREDWAEAIEAGYKTGKEMQSCNTNSQAKLSGSYLASDITGLGARLLPLCALMTMAD